MILEIERDGDRWELLEDGGRVLVLASIDELRYLADVARYALRQATHCSYCGINVGLWRDAAGQLVCGDCVVFARGELVNLETSDDHN